MPKENCASRQPLGSRKRRCVKGNMPSFSLGNSQTDFLRPPDFANGQEIMSASKQPYAKAVVPQHGWARIQTQLNNHTVIVYLNGTYIQRTTDFQGGADNSILIPVRKGDLVSWAHENGDAMFEVYFVPIRK